MSKQRLTTAEVTEIETRATKYRSGLHVAPRLSYQIANDVVRLCDERWELLHQIHLLGAPLSDRREVTVLPDGSACDVIVLPLPENHWMYEPIGECPYPTLGESGDALGIRRALTERIRTAGRYAIKAATSSGKEMDFDPDALLQNFVLALMGPPSSPESDETSCGI